VAIGAGILTLTNLPMPMQPNATNLERKLLPPNFTNWLGTDNLGRDVLSRMVAGSTISLTVGFVAMAVSLSIGIVIGAISGYLGGWVDNVLMRIVDALLCFPSFFLILTAIALLGFAAVKSIAMAASLTRMFRGGSVAGGFEARELWKHTIAVATAARALAPKVSGIDPSDAFMAGLMHDIGIIVELQACRDEFGATVAAVAADEALSFLDAEVRHIGATHEAFGLALCTAWRFPSALATVTGYHHRPLLLTEDSGRLTALIHIGDHLAARAGLGYSRTVDGSEIDSLVLQRLALTDADIAAVSETLGVQVEEVFQLLTGDG
jgi:HD-like signal output (HDOD) protein